MTSIRLKIEESWYASMDCKVQKSGPWVCFYGGHSTGYKLGNHPKNIEPCAHRARTVCAPCDNAPLDILTAAGPPQDQQATKHRAMLTAALEDLAAAIRLSLQQYKLEDGSPLYEASKMFFLLIAQSKECEEQLQMIEGNDEPARKKLYDRWTHVNQQMAQTETNIYNLLQNPDSNLDSTIKTQQEEVLRQQQVLVDQRASMDRRLAVAIGVSPAKKKAKGSTLTESPKHPPT